MKKSNSPDDELRSEYDFSKMKGGVRGKHYRRLREEGSNIVLLDPEIADAFPSEASVNEALRGVLNTTRAVRRTGGLPNKAMKPTSRERRKKNSTRGSRAARG